MNEPRPSSCLAIGDHSVPERVGLLVMRKVSMISISCIAEAFLAANKNTRENLYSVEVIVPEPKTDFGSTGLKVGATGLPKYHEQFDIVLVCGGFGGANSLGLDSLAWLRHQRSRGANIGGVGDAVIELAKHGLLNPEAAAFHCNIIRGAEETLNLRNIQLVLYSASGESLSSMGGIAALDLVLFLISEKHGKHLAASISDLFVYGRIRGPLEDADKLIRYRVGLGSTVVESAVRLMRANIEEPLSQRMLADATCVSLRQLQRSFKNYLGTTPATYYKELRVVEASRLLVQGGISVTEISYACGFKSPSHFAKVFREKFDVTPSEYAGL